MAENRHCLSYYLVKLIFSTSHESARIVGQPSMNRNDWQRNCQQPVLG